MKLPTNVAAERSIIGCILLGGLETAYEAGEAVPSNVFFDDETRDVYETLLAMSKRGDDVDVVSLDSAWRAAGKGKHLPEWVMATMDTVPSPKNLPVYVKDALKAFQSRKLVHSLHPMLLKAQEGTVEPADLVRDAKVILDEVDVLEPKVLFGKESAQDFINYLERLHEMGGQLSGLSTGFHELDKKLCGLQYGELTIIAARPSRGKTAIGLNIAAHICLKNRVPTLIISAEMSKNSLLRRMLSSWCKIPMEDLKKGGYSTGVFSKLLPFGAMLTGSPLYIVEAVGGIDSHRVSMLIQKYARRYGVKFVMIDYLQKLKGPKKAEKKTYEIGDISGDLKAAAVKSGVALLTLAQLNRESEKDRDRLPRPSDLAESGKIEQDADTIVLIHRVETETDPHGKMAKLVIGKQREGETGVVELVFEGQYCEFRNRGYGDENDNASTNTDY